MELMTKKDRGNTDRHKHKALSLRLEEEIRVALEELAKRNYTDKTHEARQAIITRLKEAGLWPPKENPS